MINFKTFLSESRSAPLYHATSSGNALNIIESDTLKRGYGKEPGLDKETISLTRNLTFAKNWINEQWGKGVIFELDQVKITQRYKIVPYNYFGTSKFSAYRGPARHIPTRSTYSKGKDYIFDNQFEEAVLTDIKNISKYITKIYVMRVTSSDTLKAVVKLNVPIVDAK